MTDTAAAPAAGTASRRPAIPEAVVAAFDDAQRRTIALVSRVVAGLEPGITEREVARRLVSGAAESGFSGWFHRPHVRFGGSPRPPALPGGGGRRLARGDIVEIDLAPATAEAHADFGVALVFGEDEPEIVAEARDLCRACCGFASRWKTTGEVFVYAQAWARNRGHALADEARVGHRVFAPGDRPWGRPWPLGPRLAILMRRHQVQWFNPRRMHGLYAIQPRLRAGDRACAFEEMILVDGDRKRVLGRDGLDAVGTLP